jgi:AcrR family transcriptional regulator
MLYVRITESQVPSPVDDLTARARIRDAAIACFAANGFDATVRDIAARAGVSAGLITHHFGSKDALRQACDTEVLRKILELKEDGIHRPPSQAIARIAELDNYGAMFGYTLRSVREGGEAGRVFLRNLIEDAKAYTAEAVESGIVRPSADPDARAELLVTQSIGGMLLQLSLKGETDFSDAGALIRRFSDETTFATLELYTQGLLTDGSLLEEYVKQVPEGAPKSQGVNHD